jgi:hypothetical protein
VYRGVKVAIQTEYMQLLVVLVLVDAVERDLDDGVDYFGALLPDRQF